MAEYRKRRLGGGVDFGREFGRVAEVRVGYQSYDLKLYPQIGDPAVLPTVQGRVGDARMQFQLIRVDNPVIPRQGQYVVLNNDWYEAFPNAPNPFNSTEGHISLFQRISAPASVYFSAAGGTTYGYHQTGVPQFALGGSVRGLPAYGSNELLTNQYFLFTGGYIRQLVQLPPFLGDHLYFVTNYQIGKAYALPLSVFPKAPPLSSNLPMSGTAGFIVNTIFGPVLVGGAVGDTGHQRFFFQLGRIF